MKTNTDQLFIMPLERELSGSESEHLLSNLNEFLEKWNSHGNPISSEAFLEESRFLIIRNPDGMASGCSKDKLFRELEQLFVQMNLQPEQAGKFYIQSKGVIYALSRKELRMKQEAAEILPDDFVFPTWVSDSGEFYKSWKKPLHFFSNLLLKKDLV